MIPYVDLRAQYRSIKSEIDQAIAKVLEESQFILGKEVAALEKEFAGYCCARFAVGTNSGTSALHLALLAAGIGPGHEVITVPFTFVATVAAILYAGAKPVLVDVDPQSYTIDVDKIEAAITKSTRALLPVHLFGQPADMDPILEIARRHKLIVIEDAAQAHGATYKGRRVGSIGDLACFSFYPGKNLGAYGEAGMVVTGDESRFRTVGMLRDWGQEQRYLHVMKGYNYRMEGIQGAVLRVKLRHLEEWTEARRSNAAEYNRLLSAASVQIPVEMPYSRHVYHVYAIRVRERDLLRQDLTAQGIQTGVHYPIPIHLLPAYSDLGYAKGSFPVSEQLAGQVLSLPIYAELNADQIGEIASVIRKACG
ncbi:MAG TPA: DegT/DnrJ/EryC1/StrS family aminotransferase [Acidobacteriota bacterium]|nr:DegT/DnrJ/EryC1/StrS family aminotransferase [Acidobacteriota bacterium]